MSTWNSPKPRATQDDVLSERRPKDQPKPRRTRSSEESLGGDQSPPDESDESLLLSPTKRSALTSSEPAPMEKRLKYSVNLKKPLHASIGIKLSKEAAKESKKMAKDRENVVSKFAPVTCSLVRKNMEQPLHACISIHQEEEVVSKGTSVERPFWNAEFTFPRTSTELVRFSIWNSVTEEDMGQVTIKYKDLKLDQVEEKTYTLKGSKAKLRVRTHLVPKTTPFDAMFRLLEQKEEVLHNVYDLADQLNEEGTGNAIVSFLYYRNPDLLPKFIEYCISSSSETHGTLTRTLRKTVITYIMLYREFFLDDCISDVVRECYEMDADDSKKMDMRVVRRHFGRLLVSLKSALTEMPERLRTVFQHLASAFRNDAKKVVLDLLITSIICPTLVVPVQMGVWATDEVEQPTPRVLMTLSNLIKALANNTRFPEGNRHFELNDYLDQKQPVIDELYDGIVKPPAEFLRCLTNPATRRLLREFLEKNHCEENINFWEAVQTYKTCDVPRERLMIGKALFKKYLDQGAECEVNVDVDARRNIKAILDDCHSPANLFEDAESWVYQLMATGSYVGLIQSKPYKEYKASLAFIERDLFMPYALSLTASGEALHLFMCSYLQPLEAHISADVAVRKIVENIGEVIETEAPAATDSADSYLHRRALSFCELMEKHDLLSCAVVEAIAMRKRDHVAQSVYTLLSATGERLPTLKKLIAHCVKVDLFQTNGSSIAMKLLGSYVQLVREDFLDVFRPVVREIVEENVSIDIRKLEGTDPKELEASYRNLRHYGKEILDALQASIGDLPEEIRNVCRLIEEAARSASADEAQLREVFGSVLFHRLVCPAIVQPSKYITQFGEVPLEASRSLILLSKFMVNIGSGVVFPDDNPLSSLNPFVRQNRENVQSFYRKVVSPPLQGFARCMANAKIRQAFAQFLQSRGADENMLFYEAIQRYEVLSAEARKAEARQIYNQFVVSGSPYEVNLDSSEQNAISAGLDEATPFLFEDAKNWVYQLMGSGMYMKFSISPEGKAVMKPRPQAVTSLNSEEVERHTENIFVFLRSMMDEMRAVMLKAAPVDEDLELHKKEVEGQLQALRNIIGDAKDDEDEGRAMGSEEESLSKAVETMLQEDAVVATALFDAVRDAEQSYVCYCLTYLFYKKNRGPALFEHALQRDFDSEKIGISNLKENFVLQLAGKYLRLHRENTFEVYVIPPIVQGWEAYMEAVSKKGEKRQKVFLECLATVTTTIINQLAESAFDLPANIRDLSGVVLAVMKRNKMQLLFPRLMSELIFRNFICSLIQTDQMQIIKKGNLIIRPQSKKESKRQIETFDTYISSINELLLAASSGNSISPSSPLSQLNELVLEQKAEALKLYHGLAETRLSGLAGCLQSSKTRAAFHAFLQKTHSEENLEFWQDVEEYRKLTNPRQLTDTAMKLYIKYMAAGSEHMIVIDEGEKNRIKKLLLKPTADLFDVAQAGVYEHMSTSSYLTFTVNHPQGKGATERSKISLEPTGMREVFFSSVLEHIEVVLFRSKEMGAAPESLQILASIQNQHDESSGNGHELPVPPEVVSEVIARTPRLYRELYKRVRKSRNKQLSCALLDMLAYSQEGLSFLKWAIDFEMSATGAKWYEQEIISDVMRHFVHVQRGTYLKDTVSHLSYEIVRQGIELQIATGNSMLCKYADSILALLTDTSHDIPDEIRELARHISGITNDSRPVLGPLLFEHFVCNGIFSPDLLQRLPDTAAKRSLVILARLVCNIGAGKLFDENDILFQLNPFVEKSNPQVVEILKRVVTVEETHQTLLTCLKSKKRRMGFRDFLKTPGKSKFHLLELWEEIQQFNSSIDGGERAKRAQGIYSKYLASKERDIGIDSKLRNEVKKELSNPSSLTFMPIMRFLLQSLDKEHRAYMSTSRHIQDEFAPTPPAITKSALRSSAADLHFFLKDNVNAFRSEATEKALKKLEILDEAGEKIGEKEKETAAE